MAKLVSMLAGVLLLTGCSEAGSESRGAADVRDTASATLSVGDSTRQSAAPINEAAPGAVLALDDEGLRLLGPTSGSSRPVPFGTPKDQVVDVLSKSLGRPPEEMGENEDCGAEYAIWQEHLTVWFSDGNFIGWAARSPGLKTPSGIGVGSTRTEVEKAYRVQVFESSLGTEFTAGGLAGIFESTGQSARVSNVWAGDTCMAR